MSSARVRMPIGWAAWTAAIPRATVALASCALLLTSAPAQESPCFRGPNRDGTYPDARIRTDWKQKPPAVLWRKDVGQGFSQVVTAAGKAVTAGYIEDGAKSVLYALDPATGNELWRRQYADACGGQRTGASGPVATPAIDGGRIYVVATMGAIHCLDLQTGEPAWSQTTNKDPDPSRPNGEYGDGVSPVVVGDLVVAHLTTGANSAAWHAFRKQDGSLAWSHPIARRVPKRRNEIVDRAYSCAVPHVCGGTNILILVSNAAIDGVELASGRLLWRHSIEDMRLDYGPFPDPLVFDDDKFFLGIWYAPRENAAVFQVHPDSLSRVWGTRTIGKGAYSYVRRDGYVYGFGSKGLQCVDLKTGEARWSWRSDDPALASDQGEIILVGDKLVWISSSGVLYIAEASPEHRRPLGSFRVLDRARSLGKGLPRYNSVVCTSPSLAGGRLFCRAPWGDLACVDLSE